MDYTYVGMVQKIRNSRYYFPICLIRMIHNIYILLLSPMCVCAVCHCNSPYYHLTECCVRHVYTKLYLIRQDEDNDPSFLPRFSPESHKYIHIHRLTSIFSIFWLLRTGTSRIELSCIFGVWCIWRRITTRCQTQFTLFLPRFSPNKARQRRDLWDSPVMIIDFSCVIWLHHDWAWIRYIEESRPVIQQELCLWGANLIGESQQMNNPIMYFGCYHW